MKAYFDMAINTFQPPTLSTNPRLIGPGTWFSIHTIAMSCDDLDSCLFFIQFVKAIIESFPCEDCRTHGLQYVKAYPPEKNLHLKNNADEHIGMFTWSWQFHNAVNMRLQKERISFTEAWNLYTMSSVCTGDCDQELPSLRDGSLEGYALPSEIKLSNSNGVQKISSFNPAINFAPRQ